VKPVATEGSLLNLKGGVTILRASVPEATREELPAGQFERERESKSKAAQMLGLEFAALVGLAAVAVQPVEECRNWPPDELQLDRVSAR